MPEAEVAGLGEGRLDALLLRFVHLTHRVRRPLFWRLLYGAMASRAGVAAGRLALRLMAATRGDAAAAGVNERLFHALVRSGWPHHEPGWHNLDAARWLIRISRRPQARVRRATRPTAAPRRVGAVGRFNKLFGFPPELFAATPPGLELHVFDVPWHGDRAAPFLADLAAGYGQFPIEDPTWVEDVARLARAVDAADLDLLLVIGEKADVYDLLDLVAPRAVAFVAQGADLLYHDAVDFHLFAEEVADYPVTGHRLFCATSRRPFGDQEVIPARIYYDRRGIDPAGRRSWTDREPLLVFHGSLYKALSPEYLDALFALLREDDTRELALMGRDWDGRRAGGAWEAIRTRAAAAGVAGQVRYEGAFSPSRGRESGSIEDPGWQRLLDLLARARLAPDPWPLGGASARVEAFLAGVPVPHLAVRSDAASWGRPQHALVDVPALRVEATATASPDEYVALCRRLLADGAFADAVAAEQVAVAERVTDAGAWWSQLLEAYEAWFAGARGRRR